MVAKSSIDKKAKPLETGVIRKRRYEIKWKFWAILNSSIEDCPGAMLDNI